MIAGSGASYGTGAPLNKKHRCVIEGPAVVDYKTDPGIALALENLDQLLIPATDQFPRRCFFDQGRRGEKGHRR